MITTYSYFVNEGFFNKTFEERIEKIEQLIIESQKYKGILLTQIKDLSPYKLMQKQSYGEMFSKNLAKISDKLKYILTRYGRKMTQDEMNIFTNCFFSYMDLCGNITFPVKHSDYINNTVFNINSIIQILHHLKKTKNLTIKRGDNEFPYLDEDGTVDFMGLMRYNKYQVYLSRQSKIDKKEKELKDKHKDVDPYGEEDWSDMNEWYNYDEEDDFEEEDEIDDPIIHVGDRVVIKNHETTDFGGRVIKFNEDRGEVIRMWDRHMNTYHMVVKFDNRRDLYSSKLSKYKDCFSFFVGYNGKYEKYNILGKPGATITKIG